MSKYVMAALAAVVLARSAPAAEKALACQDPTAIQWFTPGSFEKAQKAAQTQKRLMMIKGIAFGVDAEGAKNAIKGCW